MFIKFSSICDKICGLWNLRGSSNVGVGASKTRVCASAFCIHLWLWSRRQWRALRTPYVAQSNVYNMCKGSFVRCFIITVIISTKQRGFCKTLEIMHDIETKLFIWIKNIVLSYITNKRGASIKFQNPISVQ